MIAVFAVPALVIGLGFSVAMFFRWRLGFYGLLFYLPFAGAVTLTLFPSELPKIFKDLIFVVPLYFVLFAFHLREFRDVRVPRSVVAAMLMLTVLVLVQMANPNVVSLAVALVGAKVWLLYLPLVFVTYAFIRDRDDLTKLMRFMVVLAPIPCVLGLVQFLQAQATGVVPTMNSYYGDAAFIASFRYAQFNFGGITMFRIPSTFTFVAQYFGFTLSMIVPAYFVWQADPNARWRFFGGAVLVLSVVAGFLSGARAAFVLIPPMLALMALLEGRIVRVLLAVPIAGLLLVFAVSVVGFDPGQLADDVQTRAVSEEGTGRPVVEDFLVALNTFSLGAGTGTNTLGARSVTDDGAIPVFLETYYGKSITELGIPGLFVVLFLFLTVLFGGTRALRALSDQSLRRLAMSILVFVLMTLTINLKGFQIDMDPINVYFWVFVGVMFRLPYLEKVVTAGQAGGSTRMSFHHQVHAA